MVHTMNHMKINTITTLENHQPFSCFVFETNFTMPDVIKRKTIIIITFKSGLFTTKETKPIIPPIIALNKAILKSSSNNPISKTHLISFVLYLFLTPWQSSSSSGQCQETLYYFQANALKTSL